ncbi:hypothetical protein BHE74_00024997 [Ensete ventricosum]|nr:hypothetical protein BHE74_00024997 [Ensete ventricosum]
MLDWGFTVTKGLQRQVPARLLETQHWAPQLISNCYLIIRQVWSKVELKEVGKVLPFSFLSFMGRECVAGKARQRFLTLTGGVGMRPPSTTLCPLLWRFALIGQRAWDPPPAPTLM